MDLSTRLGYLFGTEEYVSMRRQLVLLGENFMNYHNYDLAVNRISSGSLGEGVAYPKSDDDMMFSMKYYRVVMSYSEATHMGDLLMVPSKFSPGYCHLLDLKRTFHRIIYMMEEMPFISSSLWKQNFVEEGQYIHGPCQSFTIGSMEYDYAVCLPCYSWPDIANDWVIRTRTNEWPSCDLIQNILSNGCHVVPIGDPGSPYADHEWRISFSVAERTLMHSFNHTQFLVYNLLRLTLKRVVEKNIPGVLCSYFMKTSLYYTIEKTSMEFWRVENLERCFKLCISVLYDYVYYIYCPNYFIPEYNMLKQKVNHTNRHQMLDMLRTVYEKGIVGVLQLCGESSCLDARLSARIMEYKLDVEFLYSVQLHNTLGNIEDFSFSIQHENIESCSFFLRTFWNLLKCNHYTPFRIQSELIHIIWNTGINSYCLKMMDFLSSLSKMKFNKQNYCLFRTLEALLRIGFRGDVTTRKLTTAMYMYLVGKTDSVVHVIRQLLLEYPPYAIDVSKDKQKKLLYIFLMCGRGLTIHFKTRHAHAPSYRLNNVYLYAFPSPLKMWLTIMDDFELDPLTYAYFLESLCHLQNQNTILFMKCLRCLVNHMSNLEFVENIFNTRMCVGILMNINGNKQSACRWFRSAHGMTDAFPSPFNEKHSRSALTYIACSLHKTFQSLR